MSYTHALSIRRFIKRPVKAALMDVQAFRKVYNTTLGSGCRMSYHASRCNLKLNSALYIPDAPRKTTLSPKRKGASAGYSLSSGSRAIARNGVEDDNLVPSSDAQRRTIYAVATPPGKGGVAVIRISGPDALHVYYRMVKPSNTRCRANDRKGQEVGERAPEPRKLVRCRVVDPVTEEDLDDGMAVFFKGMLRIMFSFLAPHIMYRYG